MRLGRLIFVVTDCDTKGADIMWTKLIWVLCFGILLFSPRSPAIAADADYAINPGDILQITVWKEDGLDKETLVLPDGTISFPLIGSLTARGKTVAALQQEIKTKSPKTNKIQHSLLNTKLVHLC